MDSETLFAQAKVNYMKLSDPANLKKGYDISDYGVEICELAIDDFEGYMHNLQTEAFDEYMETAMSKLCLTDSDITNFMLLYSCAMHEINPKLEISYVMSPNRFKTPFPPTAEEKI